MKRLSTILSLVALLALAACLAGCFAGQQRGVSGTAYMSSSRPAILVNVPGIPLLTGGQGRGTLSDEAMSSPLIIDVWTNVYGSDAKSPMVVVAHAELPTGWIWTTVYPRFGGTPVTTEVIGGRDFYAFTYLVPCDRDPLGGMVNDPVDGPRYWLARYYATLAYHRQGKIIVEYREPAPADLLDVADLESVDKATLASFEERARKAFSVEVPGEGAQAVRGYAQGVRWQYMRDEFLGPIMEVESSMRGSH